MQRPQHRPVAAEDDGEVGVVAVDDLDTGAVGDRLAGGRARRAITFGSPWPTTAILADRAQPTASSIQRSRSSGSRAPGGGRGGGRAHGFPSGRAAPSLRRRARLPSHSRAASATSRTTLARVSGAVTTPRRPTSPRPASNWGLTSTTASQPGAASRSDGRQRLPDRDERDVADDEPGRERQLSDLARVHALEDGHARIVPQPGVQLAVADVERDHPGRAALEEDVREPAGRGADVEAVATGRIDAEGVERVRELLAAARDEARSRARRRARPSRRPARPPSNVREPARRGSAPAPARGSPRALARRGGGRGASSPWGNGSRKRAERPAREPLRRVSPAIRERRRKGSSGRAYGESGDDSLEHRRVDRHLQRAAPAPARPPVVGPARAPLDAFGVVTYPSSSRMSSTIWKSIPSSSPKPATALLCLRQPGGPERAASPRRRRGSRSSAGAPSPGRLRLHRVEVLAADHPERRLGQLARHLGAG